MAGNRLMSVGARVMLGALSRAEYVYNPDTMRLEEDSVYVFTYDGRGNIIKKTRKGDGLTWDYTYDAEDKMLTARRRQGAATAADADGNVYWLTAEEPDAAATYTYDFIGRRTSKEVNGRVVRYAYAGLNLAAEYANNEAEPSTAYFYLPGALDHPMAMVRAMASGDPAAGETFYYHYDERGSVVALTNEAGETVQRYEYDTFGNMTLVEGDVANPFTFTAREWDAETGLYYFRARYYDPETGRFLQTDPIYALGLYAYAENNPVMFTDPLGLSSIGMQYAAPGANVSSYNTPDGKMQIADFVCTCDRVGVCSGNCLKCKADFRKFVSAHPLRDGWACPDDMCRCDFKGCIEKHEVDDCKHMTFCATCHKNSELLGLKDPPERDACEYYYGLKCDQFDIDPCLVDYQFACFGMPAPEKGGEGPGRKPDDSEGPGGGGGQPPFWEVPPTVPCKNPPNCETLSQGKPEVPEKLCYEINGGPGLSGSSNTTPTIRLGFPFLCAASLNIQLPQNEEITYSGDLPSQIDVEYPSLRGHCDPIIYYDYMMGNTMTNGQSIPLCDPRPRTPKW